jgi:CheY-like chemotaxis protein
MRIIVADDSHTDLVILETILRKEGHEVITATDGAKAFRAFEEHAPDIVLLDALMPVMDGYEAARRIKKLSSEKDIFTPIIFLTSLKDAPALAGCLEAGGDDFLSKPYNKMILQAKLRAFERVRQMHITINSQREALKQNHESMLREQDIAKRVFDNVAPSGCLDMEGIRHVLSPCSVFNGDMLLVSEKPSGGIHIMMGDFTGHGLQAAIGALPASEVFYGMTRKGFAIQDILIEINKRLKKILPTGLFCCASFADIDYRNQTVTTWTGGTPDGYIFRQGEGVVHTIKSHNLPLGILGTERFDASTRVFSFEEGDIIYLFSDGIVEAENSEEEMFGHKRVEAIMEKHKDEKGVFDPLFEALNEFTGVEAQGDDITLVEVECRPSAEGTTDEKEADLETHSGPQEWSIDYCLKPGSIKQFDPLPLLLNILMECPGLQPHRGRLYTILSEIYSNAL